jgi:hypothetical protein
LREYPDGARVIILSRSCSEETSKQFHVLGITWSTGCLVRVIMSWVLMQSDWLLAYPVISGVTGFRAHYWIGCDLLFPIGLTLRSVLRIQTQHVLGGLRGIDFICAPWVVVLLPSLYALHLYVILGLLIEPAGDNPTLRKPVRDFNVFSLGCRSRYLLGKHGANGEPREMSRGKDLPGRNFV